MDSASLTPIFLAGSAAAVVLIVAIHYLPLASMGIRLPILGRYVLGALILFASFLAASWVGDLLRQRLTGWQWAMVLGAVIVAAGATTFLCYGVDAYINTHHRAASAEDKAASLRGELTDGR